MKRVINFLMSGAIVLGVQIAKAQNADDARMTRDVEIAENVLSTLIKQEFSQRNFFPLEVRGSYRSGYGVTFTVPTDVLMPMIWGGSSDVIMLDGVPGAYSYSFSTTPEPAEMPVLERDEIEKEKAKQEKEMKAARKEVEKAEKAEKVTRAESEYYKRGVEGGRVNIYKTRDGNRDSLQAVYTTKIIQAAKNFLADYGDMLSQLKADEKIVITNQGDHQRWYGQNTKRSVLLVEASKNDLTQFRQGKITRDQLIAKIKVTNTESTGKREADLEILTSVFNRLYSSDLSATFFTEGNTYYEKLTDYGAIVYMQVYSSNQTGHGLFNMPTVDLQEVDQAGRDRKVKELYPVFEKELKENILEYGYTVKSLKDNEQLVFNVVLTKCKGCGIPSDIEVAVPYSVLKDFSSGKIDKASALARITVKKGAGQ